MLPKFILVLLWYPCLLLVPLYPSQSHTCLWGTVSCNHTFPDISTRLKDWWVASFLIIYVPPVSHINHTTQQSKLLFFPFSLPPAEMQHISRHLYCDVILCDRDLECKQDNAPRNKNGHNAACFCESVITLWCDRDGNCEELAILISLLTLFICLFTCGISLDSVAEGVK